MPARGSRTPIRREVLEGSPLEGLFVTGTGADGSFAFQSLGPGSALKLGVTGGDGRRFVVRPETRAVEHLREHMEDEGFTTAARSAKTPAWLHPAARSRAGS